MVNISKLTDSLPNAESTKLYYFSIKLNSLSVNYYRGRRYLVDPNNEALSTSAKNSKGEYKSNEENKEAVQKKKGYFDELDRKKKSAGMLALFDLKSLSFEIILGHDFNLEVPISAAILYTNVGNFSINIQSSRLNELKDIGTKFSEIFSFSNLQQIRPFLTPITDAEAEGICRILKLNTEDIEILSKLRYYIVKEYFRAVGWSSYMNYYSEASPNKNIKKWVLFQHRRSSLIYQLLTGER